MARFCCSEINAVHTLECVRMRVSVCARVRACMFVYLTYLHECSDKLKRQKFFVFFYFTRIWCFNKTCVFCKTVVFGKVHVISIEQVQINIMLL